MPATAGPRLRWRAHGLRGAVGVFTLVVVATSPPVLLGVLIDAVVIALGG